MAYHCFRNRRCRSPWSPPVSPRPKPTVCAAASPRSSAWAPLEAFGIASFPACWHAAMTPIFQRALCPDRRVRQLGFSRKPRRQLCSAGLYLGLAELPPSAGLHLCAAEQPADGFLCPGTAGARCPRPWRRGARSSRSTIRFGFARWNTVPMAGWPCVWGSGRSRACGKRMPAGSRRHAAMAIPTSKACGGGQVCIPLRWNGWPRLMPLPLLVLPAAMRCGPPRL